MYKFNIGIRAHDLNNCPFDNQIRMAALLHDIGKIGIPDAILNKPAKLSDDEYEVMKTHVVRGGEILKDFSLIELIAATQKKLVTKELPYLKYSR